MKIDLAIDGTEYLSSEPWDLDDNPGITDLETRDCYVVLRFKVVQFGTFKSKDSCLIIVEATFHPTASGARFKYALVELGFEVPPDSDATNATLPRPSAPRVDLLAPSLCYGNRGRSLTRHRSGWSSKDPSCQVDGPVARKMDY